MWDKTFQNTLSSYCVGHLLLVWILSKTPLERTDLDFKFQGRDEDKEVWTLSNFHTWPLPSYTLTQTDISQWLTANIKDHKSFYNLQKEILDQQQRERNDTSFRGACMFCTEEFHGNRFVILQLSEMLWTNLSSLPFIKGFFFNLD